MPELLKKRSAATVLGLVLVAGTSMPAIAQDEGADQAAADASSQPSAAQLLEDFIFYVNTANIELAQANANALVALDMTNLEFLGTVEDSPTMQQRFDLAYRRALVMPGLEDAAAKLYMLYTNGRRDRARQPEEIERNIKLLTGTMGNRLFARDRLVEAREYAVPYLLNVLIDSRDGAERAEVASMLTKMGRDAIVPLCEALLKVGPETQEQIANILGEIQYRTSLPYLYELRASTDNDRVRAAVDRAIAARDNAAGVGAPVGELYRALGDTYFTGTKSVLTFPGEEHQLLWSFEPALGLAAQAIRTEVFHEARAMTLAEKALTANPEDQEAVALWIAANFQREIDTPEGYENPAYPAGRRDAMYYAVAAGSGPAQRVLERGLVTKNTRLARRAIEALSRSAGGADIVRRGETASPLVQAMDYPDRRVRYEAALAIAGANPPAGFAGADRVVPVLASVIGEASARYAVVIADQPEQQQRSRQVLEDLGYKVLAPAATLDAMSEEIVNVPGVDVVVVHQAGEAALGTITQIRADSRLSVTPVLAMMPVADVNRLETRLTVGANTEFRGEGINDAQLAQSIEELVTRATGPAIDDEEGDRYSMAAIEALEKLAVGGAGAMDVGGASNALITALKGSEGDVQQRLGLLLGHICRPGVQNALVEAAFEVDGQDRVGLLHAAGDSARRCGNQLDERLTKRVIEAASTAEGDEATAAAALLGSLNLPNARVVPLIVGEQGKAGG